MARRKEEPWQLPGEIRGENVRLQKGGGGYRPLSSASKARLRRIVNRAPEVVVKVTGRTRGGDGKHLKAHFDYITRNGKIEAETQDGEIIRDRHRLRDLHEDWMFANATMARGPATPRSAQSVGIILSMPAGTSPDKVEAAGRTWARETFGNKHDWVMARHDDTDHAHVHIAVRAVDNDGRRLAPGPADLQEWRERFARELKRYGVEAEASPRHARGSLRKSLNAQAYQNLGVTTRSQTNVTSGATGFDPTPTKRAQSRDWNEIIEKRQSRVRQSYLDHAKALAKGDAADRLLAHDIERFVEEMPVSLARRQAVGHELQHIREQQAAQNPRTPVAPAVAPHVDHPTPRPAAIEPSSSPSPSRT